MMFDVPQFVNVEDKIAGPLTWRQLLWMIGLGAALMLLFSIFETAFAIILGIPTTLLLVAFAFYRPNGFPLTTFVFHGILFLFRPKIAVWERPVRHQPQAPPSSPQKNEQPTEKKILTDEKLRELAKIVDSTR